MALIFADNSSSGSGMADDFFLKVDSAFSSTPQQVKDKDDNLSSLFLSSDAAGVNRSPESGYSLDILTKNSDGSSFGARVTNLLGDELFVIDDQGNATVKVSSNSGTLRYLNPGQNAGLVFGGGGTLSTISAVKGLGIGDNTLRVNASRFNIHSNLNAGGATRDIGFDNPFRDLYMSGNINTGAPTTGTADSWRLGSYINSPGGTVDTDNYIEVEVGGVFYKLVTFN
jgi:hypothetical protein